MSNIVNDLVEDYIRNILKENKSLILEMEEYAKENSVPIIHKEVAELLRFILDIHNSHSSLLSYLKLDVQLVILQYFLLQY